MGLEPGHLMRFGALALCFVWTVPQARGAEVRFWSMPEVTRIAVPSNGEAPVRSERLINPDRIFFDIPTVLPLANHRKMQAIPVNDALVKQIRLAETQPGVTRVVCDLNGPAEFVLSHLTNPDRVIIELRHTGSSPVSKATSTSEVASAKSSGPKQFVPPAARLARVDFSGLAVDNVRQVVLTSRVPQDGSKAVPHAKFPLWAAVEQPVKTSSVPLTASARTTVARAMPAVVTVAPVTPATVIARETETGLMAKRTSEGDRTLARVLGLKMTRIVIDAGHGGHDVGTTGPTGLNEKDLVLDVARRLGSLVEQRMGAQVIYTRGDDTFIPLEKRTEIANAQKADLFLSIHANSSPVKTASGVETYYLNFTTSRDALDTAARENAGSQGTMYDLNDLIRKIALKDKVDESKEFAASVQTSLFNLSSRNNPKAKDRGVRKAPFVVLIGAQMPSILAEVGFVSNPRDEAAMKRPETRQKIAEALYKGLSGYAGTLSHFQVARQAGP